MKRIFQRGLLLATFILGLVFHLTAQSTQMTVHLNDGTERTYSMSEEDRIYFEDNETLVISIIANTNAPSTDRINLADIRKITCQEVEGTAENNAQKPVIFPNPVHETLILRNLNSKETIFIYTFDGQLMKSLEVTGNQPIDISDLSMGLYLVKTQSCTLKMIKL